MCKSSDFYRGVESEVSEHALKVMSKETGTSISIETLIDCVEITEFGTPKKFYRVNFYSMPPTIECITTDGKELKITYGYTSGGRRQRILGVADEKERRYYNIYPPAYAGRNISIVNDNRKVEFSTLYESCSYEAVLNWGGSIALTINCYLYIDSTNMSFLNYPKTRYEILESYLLKLTPEASPYDIYEYLVNFFGLSQEVLSKMRIRVMFHDNVLDIQTDFKLNMASYTHARNGFEIYKGRMSMYAITENDETFFVDHGGQWKYRGEFMISYEPPRRGHGKVLTLDLGDDGNDITKLHRPLEFYERIKRKILDLQKIVEA